MERMKSLVVLLSATRHDLTWVTISYLFSTVFSPVIVLCMYIEATIQSQCSYLMATVAIKSVAAIFPLILIQRFYFTLSIFETMVEMTHVYIGHSLTQDVYYTLVFRIFRMLDISWCFVVMSTKEDVASRPQLWTPSMKPNN